MSVVATATAGPTALWYLTRSTGAVTLILLTLSVALGVANVRRAQTEQVPRFVFDAVHRNASLLAIAFLFVHIVHPGTRGVGRCGRNHGVQRRPPVHPRQAIP